MQQMPETHEPAVPLPGEGEALVSDQDLLREYAITGSESAFAQLVQRHVPLVYSAALRQTANHAMAQDIAQAVFVILARKAPSLRRETVLAGWLFRAVRYAASDARKIEARRQNREQEAVHMQLTDAAEETGRAWEQLAPALDEALATLGAKDRNAILLRFFEKKNFGEIGSRLGGNENSARVRVVRAVEKLRQFFQRRGIAVSALALSSALLGQAVQAAPAGLASTVASQSVTATLVEAVLRRLWWRRIARLGAGLTLVLVVIAAITLPLGRRQARRAAVLADAARSVRNLMIAIDRTFTLNDPNGFVALVYWRNTEAEQFGPAIAEYIRAQAAFRGELARAFNVRQRSFDATFRELCFWQPAGATNYLLPDRAATNIMSAKYPVRFIKEGDAWKWDVFTDLPPEGRAQHVATLRHKTVVLQKLAREVHEGATTNVVEILDRLRHATP
jgi:RNA polymerase sigma factor (sigma-70 family)